MSSYSWLPVGAAPLASLLLVASLTAGGPASLPSFSTLQPGAFRSINQSLPVNVVFVGYEAGSGVQNVDETVFREGLPASYSSRHRIRWFYGISERTGNTFDYDFNVIYAPASFEDAFFSYLLTNATVRPLTVYQQAYNTQEARTYTIPAADNLRLDAPGVESWLAEHGADIGVDTSQYTVFFINWWGRSNFRHHYYAKRNEVDPDTGVNFGAFQSRAIIAYGGTPPAAGQPVRRVWFHDLSAGPEFNTDNWLLDEGDLNRDGKIEYRMPPIWEYGNLDAYRPFDNLSGDLSRVLRYVALNLLFTPSPLYNPAISAPKLPSTIALDVNIYQGEPGVDARQFIKTDVLVNKIGELQPLSTFSARLDDQPLAGRPLDIYNCFASGVSCFGRRLFGIAFADPFLYHSDQLLQYIAGGVDYSLPIFTYNTTEEAGLGGLLGYADDNWRDGRQSYVFTFNDTLTRSFGFGLTNTMIHEVGHHLGMSHQHDGYDSTRNIDYGPDGDFYYSWIGDESHSVMGYLFFTNGFGQFDRDNMNRYLTSVYLNQANQVLARIAASPRAASVMAALSAADGKATQALSNYAAMEYDDAAASAKSAYAQLLNAASAINVQIEPPSWQADYKAKRIGSHFVDRVPYNRYVAR